MIAHGAPVLARPRLHNHGDAYLLMESRRLIPRQAVVRAPRGSAVSSAAILVALDMDVPSWIAEQAASELIEPERLPEWCSR